LFSVPDHDASLVSENLGGVPLAGFNCAGEIGPVGGKNFLHGFTASIALLTDRFAHQGLNLPADGLGRPQSVPQRIVGGRAAEPRGGDVGR